MTSQMAVAVGTRIPALQVRPTTIQLFRFSAATWNAHRIHYDQAYARMEGYPNVLVQSHLHGCFLTNAVLHWAPTGSVLRRLRWENRGIAVPGNQLTIGGTVASVQPADRGWLTVQIELEERNENDDLCARGSAELLIQGGVDDG